MHNKIITFGLTEEQSSLLEAALPESYSWKAQDDAVAAFLEDSVCTVVDLCAVDGQDREMLNRLYSDAGVYLR